MASSRHDAYLLFALSKMINSKLCSSNVVHIVSAVDETDMRRRHLRRKRLILLLSTVVLHSIKLIFRERKLWQKVRSSEWWDRMVLETWCDEEWKDSLRVDRATFEFLCQQLRPLLVKKKIMREPISAERRLALALVKFGSYEKLRIIADLFGIARSTTCEIISHVCQAIRVKFKSLIMFPTGENLKLVIDRYLEMGGLPGCCGAIASTHIPVKAPRDSANPKEFYNQKGYNSIILQAVADHEERFMNVSIGSPGSMHKAEAFVNSSLFKEAGGGKLFSPEQVPASCSSNFVQPFVVGSSAFPLLPWLMTPSSGEASEEQKMFNDNIQKSHATIKQAFRSLKGRWRSLLKPIDSTLVNIERQVLACCYLHNICIDRHDTFPEEWCSSMCESDVECCSEETNPPRSAEDIQKYLMQWSFAKNVHNS